MRPVWIPRSDNPRAVLMPLIMTRGFGDFGWSSSSAKAPRQSQGNTRHRQDPDQS